ncbi:MAG: site-specific integrase [Gemmataceae bacterium]|nr:site-specific integrase [Gemmataceae bacterium]
MPRSPKPFPWRDGWYTDAGGTRTFLLPRTASRRDAEAELRKLLDEREQSGSIINPNLTVAELSALFLEMVQAEKAPTTYLTYQRWLTEFSKEHGAKLVRRVTRHDAQRFKAKVMKAINPRTDKPYKPKTVNHALIALKRCWNWAKDAELITCRNPFAGIPMLPADGRQRIATDDEFRALLRHSDALFRQVLLCFRYLPIRPQDLRTLQWEGQNYVDFTNHCWVIRRHKTYLTSKQKKARIILMPPPVENLLLWRKKNYPDSTHVFLNEDGNPWKKDALCLRMRRLRERAGIKADANGEEFVLYTNRHTYCTRSAAVMSGPELQALAGHSEYRTTERYVHLAQQKKLLADAAGKAAEAMRLHSPGK